MSIGSKRCRTDARWTWVRLLGRISADGPRDRMDPFQMIANEAAHRGLLGVGGSAPSMQPQGRLTSGAMGVGGAAVLKPEQPGFGWRALEAGASLIPRVGATMRAINAGPVADGTLEHARKMGWVR